MYQYVFLLAILFVSGAPLLSVKAGRKEAALLYVSYRCLYRYVS